MINIRMLNYKSFSIYFVSRKILMGSNQNSWILMPTKKNCNLTCYICVRSFIRALNQTARSWHTSTCIVLYLLLPWLLCNPILSILLPVWLCTFMSTYHYSHLPAATQLEQEPAFSSHLTFLLIESVALASSTLMRMGVGWA